MRANANATVTGERCILVPYRREHVQRYHEWMQDPALQEATASEPLSLEAEYEMQQRWAEDADKCTFIILDRSAPDTPGTGRSRGGGMAGDVNFFFNDHDDPSVAEIEVMVAEAGSRRKGVAREALTLFMAYGASVLRLSRFVAKIGEANAPSLALFTSLGFAEVSRSAVFKEVTLELAVEGAVRECLASTQLQLGAYDDDA